MQLIKALFRPSKSNVDKHHYVIVGNEPIGHAMMTQQRLIDYRNGEMRTLDVFSAMPFRCLPLPI